MNRADWAEIAKALARARLMFEKSDRPLLIKGTQIAVVDHITLMIASALAKRSARFKADKFLASIGVGRPPRVRPG